MSDDTRDHIVRQAAGIFNRQGYAGASMADLMAATGLKKGGLYWYFGSKEELAVAAFDHAVGEISGSLRSALAAHATAAGRLHGFIDAFRGFYEDPPIPGGCAVMNTAVESDDGNQLLRERARSAMAALLGTLRRIVEKGRAAGELRAEVEPDRVATLMVSSLEGALVLSRLFSDPLHLEVAADHLHALVDERLLAG